MHPLQVNPTTGEPYLRLPSPHSNIIVTPPRMSDVDASVRELNDRKVVDWLIGPPYPYLPSHAEEWVATAKQASDAILADLQRDEPNKARSPLKFVGGCPVHRLREVGEDGTDTFVGDISFRRCAFPHEGEEQSVRCEENAARAVGDPSIVWCVGYYTASSHHGRGIMSAAFRTLMTEWAIPRMNVRIMRVETYRENVASARVFEKFGFVQERVADDVVTTNTGAVWHGVRLLWWRHP
ncbi:acyl-CoA N-acyltransferase [Fomitopsis serialis]|uniref:acyl-CoA N-acyltransferase n=1 Tax=Fomitopsis serialis TaxID=139415 RepID=UPI002007DFFB|nr:acyl-CoA N-acyltransferase [Neoantrodia serialis]KAH9937339.1 acyl-CoA N-acyltransferase [Neoantrodia serialis]